MSKELNIENLNKFYEELKKNGKLIQEQVMGSNEDGDLQVFFGFEDAIDEADEEGYELETFGEAYYYFDGKILELSVTIEEGELNSVFELEQSEIHQFIKKLIAEEPYEGDSESFYNDNDWAKSFIP